MNKRLVIFSHFDVDCVIDEYVHYYLQELVKNSCDIVFVSTSNLPESQLVSIRSFCKKLICRENTGYDFMSYKTGFFESGLNYHDYEEVVICNDSVYGFLFDLNEMFDKMSANICDYWGITKCRQIKPHIQSYFLVFKTRILQSSALDIFFSNVKIIESKKEIISSYEVGLSSYLKKNKYIGAVYINTIPLKVRYNEFLLNIQKNKIEVNPNGIRFVSYLKLFYRKTKFTFQLFNKLILVNNANPTRFYWKYLLRMRCPFIKIILLRKNTEKIFSNQEILFHLKEHTNYPISIIENHLKRTQEKY